VGPRACSENNILLQGTQRHVVSGYVRHDWEMSRDSERVAVSHVAGAGMSDNFVHLYWLQRGQLKSLWEVDVGSCLVDLEGFVFSPHESYIAISTE
jgi:hypothetical protein